MLIDGGEEMANFTGKKFNSLNWVTSSLVLFAWYGYQASC